VQVIFISGVIIIDFVVLSKVIMINFWQQIFMVNKFVYNTKNLKTM